MLTFVSKVQSEAKIVTVQVVLHTMQELPPFEGTLRFCGFTIPMVRETAYDGEFCIAMHKSTDRGNHHLLSRLVHLTALCNFSAIMHRRFGRQYGCTTLLDALDRSTRFSPESTSGLKVWKSTRPLRDECYNRTYLVD